MVRHSMSFVREHCLDQNHGGICLSYLWLLCAVEFLPGSIDTRDDIIVSRLPLFLAWRNFVLFCSRTRRGLCSSLVHVPNLLWPVKKSFFSSVNFLELQSTFLLYCSSTPFSLDVNRFRCTTTYSGSPLIEMC